MQHLLKQLTSSFIAIGLGFLTLTGCSNTIQGAGHDMQNMGNALSSPHKSKPVHHKKVVKKTVTTTTETTNNPVTTTNMSGFTTSKPADTTTTTTTTVATPTPPATNH